MTSLPRFSADLSLYAWQEEALRRWSAADHRGTMKVVTGAGKTVLGLAAIDTISEADPDLRVAIVVPTIVLQRQWLEELTSRGGAGLAAGTIGLLGGGKSQGFASHRIVISVLNSASRRLADDVEAAGVGEHLLLIVDEVHRAGAAVMSRVFRTSRSYTLGLSATPERADFEETDFDDGRQLPYEESLLGKAVGPIVFELTLAQAIDQGVLPPFSINHYGVELVPAERSKYESLSQSIKDAREQLEGLMAGKGRSTGLLPYAQSLARREGPYAGLAARFIAESQERKRLLYRAAARSIAVTRLLRSEFAANPQARALLFHESIEEVEALAELLEASFPGRVAVEHSKLSDKRRSETIQRFRDGDVRLLVSVRSLIEGFNVPAADVGVIVASSSSVRQRVQTLGRLLRRHRVGRSEEKHSVMHVIYVRNSVDDAIYGQEDWDEVTGHERNTFFHYLPPDEPEVRDGPPRRPLPIDTDVEVAQLTPGDVYAGRYAGHEYSVDTQGNVTDASGTPMELPPGIVDELVAVKGSAGRFKVTEHEHHVLVLVRQADQWTTRYVTRLPAPVAVAHIAAEGAYAGPVDADGGEFSVKRSASGLRIARQLPKGRGLQFARPGSVVDDVIGAVHRIQAGGQQVTRFRVNSLGDAIVQVRGVWMLLANEGDRIEF